VTTKQNIFYEYEDIAKPPFLEEEEVSKWLNDIAKDHQSKIKNLLYIFCDDEYLLEVNKEHLGHDYYTDIITFPYEEGKIIEADILISLDRVQDNAQEYGVEYKEELMRVMVHGLLHLIGFRDKTEDEVALMREEENKALQKME
jgi:rRNA maturation RNase YbeY